MIRVIAKRYARALVELAEETKTVDKTKADLAAFARVVEDQPVLQKLFASPAFTPDHKKGVIKELAAKLGAQPNSQRFVEHLAESGRIRHLRDVHAAFENILAERQNRAVARLTSAAALSSADLADLKKTLEAVTGKSVDIESAVDPLVIGGARAQIGSVIYDGTIKNQLNKMRDQLVK